jgi:hypothetical protein
MLSGEVPFNSITTHRTAEDIVEDITRSKLSYDTPAWKNVTQAAKDLVKGLFVVKFSPKIYLSYSFRFVDSRSIKTFNNKRFIKESMASWFKYSSNTWSFNDT